MAIYFKKGAIGFYDMQYPEAFAFSGYKLEEMTEISQEDYDYFWSMPEGYYQAWTEDGPKLLEIPK